MKIITKDYNSYQECKCNIDEKDFKTALESILNMVERDIATESRNELETLGYIYNCHQTSDIESKYKYNLKEISTLTGEFKIPLEIVAYKVLNQKTFNVLETRDSSTSHTFFISKSKISDQKPLKKGEIIEATISVSDKKLRLISWKGLNK
ncbi:UNVERIFIED_CONTAM: hypothetical protein O8I53_07940 [Campylobacter lari]